MRRFVQLGLFLGISLLSGVLHAQLGPGDIMFVSMCSDGYDGLAFVALKTIPDGTYIYFTDNEWNGGNVGADGNFLDREEGGVYWEE